VSYIWKSFKRALLKTRTPLYMLDLWTCWGQRHVRTQTELNISVMVVCWLVWNERNNSIICSEIFK